ncbi:XkdX family protein [Clostridium perfringens]|nr:XkdX family protein [Clostridium perfringens]MDK0982912.1 XkdX family protein [Clostridium perfringens]
MEFWKMAYKMEAVDKETLRMAVITKENPYGDITKEQFKEICGEDFEKKEEPVEEPVKEEKKEEETIKSEEEIVVP